MAAQGLVSAAEFVAHHAVEARVAVESRRKEGLPGIVGLVGMQVSVAEHELDVLAQRRPVGASDVHESFLAQGDHEF